MASMKECNYDVKKHFVHEFNKQIIFAKECMKNKDMEDIHIGSRFTMKIPRTVVLEVPRDIKLWMDMSRWNGNEDVKKFEKKMISAYESRNTPTNDIFDILLIYNLEQKLLHTLELGKDESIIAEHEKKKKRVREIFKEVYLQETDYYSVLMKLVERLNQFFLDSDEEKKIINASKVLGEKIRELFPTGQERSVEVDVNMVWKEGTGLFSLCQTIDYTCLNFDWKMSSGERALLSILANMFDVARTKCNNSKPLILIMDELDLYLHPILQQDIVSILLDYIKRMFQKMSVQVILTTHSPLILSDIPSDKMVFLKKQDGRIKVVQMDEGFKSFGANINDLYYNSFFMEHGSMGTFAQKKIRDMIKELNGEERISGEKAKELIPVIECIGDTLVRTKLMQLLNDKMIENRDNTLKRYYQQQAAYYTRLAKEMNDD